MQATQCRLPVHVRECGGLGWVQATRGVVCLGAREMEGLGQKQARDVIHLCMRMHVEGLGWCKRRRPCGSRGNRGTQPLNPTRLGYAWRVGLSV